MQRDVSGVEMQPQEHPKTAREDTMSYSSLIAFCRRHFSRGVLEDLGIREAAEQESSAEPSLRSNAQRLAEDIEALGPTMIKAAQFFSSRSDALPPEYEESLAELQDQVKPRAFSEVQPLIEAELGAPLNKLFKDFDQEAFASASISQIHRAELRSGQEVAVKVQRAGMLEKIDSDFALLRPLAKTLSSIGSKRYADLEQMLEDAYVTIREELNFTRELANLQALRAASEDFPSIVIPRPVPDYCSNRVLTMSFVHGRKITDTSPLRLTEIDSSDLLDQLFAFYLQQILLDGIFHADPHPGNVLLTDDGRLALVDLGMVCRTSRYKQRALLSFFCGLAEPDIRRAQEATEELCRRSSTADQQQLRVELERLILDSQGRTMRELSIGRTILRIGKLTRDNGFTPPRELNYIGKVCINLEKVAEILDPEFDPSAATREHAWKILNAQMLRSLKPEQLLEQTVELKELLSKAPKRLNKLLDSFSTGIPRLEVEVLDEEYLMSGIQKVANRITLGLIVAALIIAGAHLAGLPNRYQILGYPPLTWMFFLLAAFFGFLLFRSVFARDIDKREVQRRVEH